MSEDHPDDRDEATPPEGLAGDQPDFDDEDLELIDRVWDRIAAEEADDGAADDGRPAAH